MHCNLVFYSVQCYLDYFTYQGGECCCVLYELMLMLSIFYIFPEYPGKIRSSEADNKPYICLQKT